MSIKIEHHLNWETGQEYLKATASLRDDEVTDVPVQKGLRDDMITALSDAARDKDWSDAKRPVEFDQDVWRDSLTNQVKRIDVRATVTR